MKLLISILAILLLTTSCSTVHISERKGYDNDKKLTKDNNIDLSGSYSNKAYSNSAAPEIFSLWQELFGNAKRFDKWALAHVKLQITDRNKMEASLFNDTVLIDHRTVYYKVTNGYLKLKRQYKASSDFGPVLWGAATFQVYLGQTADNRLVVINAREGIGILIVLPFGFDSYQDDHEYSKL